MEQKIKALLARIVHPESGRNIVESGMVEHIDADIYGPSQPKMFGVEGYLPDAERIDGEDCILPADAMGIKLMSIGFFIKPSDALIWRDAMATNALRQMIHQTKWGGLDFLLVDLPPGTGGVHLAVISELKVTGAVIVSTPQQVAVADVRRGVEMFRPTNRNSSLRRWAFRSGLSTSRSNIFRPR